MKISELSHVVIGTTDLQKWRDYGTKVLGMAAIDGPEGNLYLKMDGRDFRFLIQKGEKDELFASGWSVADEAAFTANEAAESALAAHWDAAQRTQLAELLAAVRG